jgi:hypothetical protein
MLGIEEDYAAILGREKRNSDAENEIDVKSLDTSIYGDSMLRIPPRQKSQWVEM